MSFPTIFMHFCITLFLNKKISKLKGARTHNFQHANRIHKNTLDKIKHTPIKYGFKSDCFCTISFNVTELSQKLGHWST